MKDSARIQAWLLVFLPIVFQFGCETKPTQFKGRDLPVDNLLVVRPDDVRVGERILLSSPSLTAGISGRGPLSVPEVEAWLADPRNHEPLDIVLPLGLRDAADEIAIPADQPLTRAKIELGRQLFFDVRLAGNHYQFSCADCHHPRDSFAFPLHNFDTSVRHGRTPPVVFNRILSRRQYWDGRSDTLELQTLEPITTPAEMGSTPELCVSELLAIPGYRLQFERIYGAVTFPYVGQALASFVYCLVTGPSPVDYETALVRFQTQDALTESQQREYEELQTLAREHPLSEAARRGKTLFFSDRLGCAECHRGPNFTDEEYHNIGIGMNSSDPDLGRFGVTRKEQDRGAFKTPTLRNVASTAPYMHRGQLWTLEAVVEWYSNGGWPHANQSPRIRRLDLTAGERQDLVAFLRALTGTLPPVATGRLPADPLP